MPAAYLDHAATTPVRPEAAAAHAEVLAAPLGNPSGSHGSARRARRLLDDARDTMAELLGCRADEVVFTSGGTEADNLAVRGVAAATGGAVACSATEHHAVIEPVLGLGGARLPVDRTGLLDLDALGTVLDPSARLVSVMLVNNETGVVHDLDEVADHVRRVAPAALLHTDAVQAFPWLDVPARAAAAALVTVSGHKFGAPPGIGALVVRRGCSLRPQLLGGGQEHDRRSGTPDVAGAVAMAAAARAAADDRKALVDRVGPWRDRLVDTVVRTVPGARATVPDRSTTVAGIANLVFEDVESEELLFLLDQAGVEASAASSCASGALEPSHVLVSLGLAPELARGSLRLSFGWTSTEADVERALASIPAAVARLREAR